MSLIISTAAPQCSVRLDISTTNQTPLVPICHTQHYTIRFLVVQQTPQQIHSKTVKRLISMRIELLLSLLTYLLTYSQIH